MGGGGGEVGPVQVLQGLACVHAHSGPCTKNLLCAHCWRALRHDSPASLMQELPPPALPISAVDAMSLVDLNRAAFERMAVLAANASNHILWAGSTQGALATAAYCATAAAAGAELCTPAFINASVTIPVSSVLLQIKAAGSNGKQVRRCYWGAVLAPVARLRFALEWSSSVMPPHVAYLPNPMPDWPPPCEWVPCMPQLPGSTVLPTPNNFLFNPTQLPLS